jgi:hypothetical protein
MTIWSMNVQGIPRHGVRQLAAALKLRLMSIMAGKWEVHIGASKLAHAKGCASEKTMQPQAGRSAPRKPPNNERWDFSLEI